MTANKNIPFYIITAGIAILLKLGYAVADNQQLYFLLKPTDTIIEWMTGSPAVFSAGTGFYHAPIATLIDSSCAGCNFGILCFCMLTVLALKQCKRILHKAIVIPSALLLAYVFTILVNSSRIFVSVIMQEQANRFLPPRPHLVLHEFIGIIINLCFLIIIYNLSAKILSKQFTHAQPATT